jgi:LacI family transcriptional regulator
VPVTIKEVAQAAGVSVAAVSKVLHGRGDSVRVSQAKAQHIRTVAKDLAYVPNALARSLRCSRTQTVGLFFENLAGIAAGPLYTMHLLDGVASEVFRNHYRLTLLSEIDAQDRTGSLADGRLDGVIWCKLARDEETLRLIHECPIPIVALNTVAPGRPSDAVFISCDNEGGIELAVDHLWSLGHRRILFLRESEEADVPDGIDRLNAFSRSMCRRGVDVGPDDVATWDWYLNDFAAWWASKPPHTAVLCWSERCAGAFLNRCAEAGVRVPDEFSVVGFDSTQYCEATHPRLTAVCQPIGEMAAHAARTLLAMIDGVRPEQSSFVFPCTLDVRDSTAPPCR